MEMSGAAAGHNPRNYSVVEPALDIFALNYECMANHDALANYAEVV